MGEELERRYVTNQAIDLMARMAKAYALSGLFDDASGELQAFVKISAGRELGLQPFESMSGISIIAGKPVVGAGILAGLVKGHPKYDYRILSHSDEECSIAFFEDGVELGVSKFTMEDARRAGLASKKVWQQYPKNMTFSRAMSNGTAFYCPDVTAGRVYVEHEIEEDARGASRRQAAAKEMIPEREPENVIDVEPEQNLAVQEPMTGTASATIDPETMKAELAAKQASMGATKIPLTNDTEGPSHTFDPSVDPLLGVETVARLAEREAIAAAQREAAKAPEQVEHEAQQASDMADDMHSAREAEVSQQEATAEQMLADRKAAGKTQSEAAHVVERDDESMTVARGPSPEPDEPPFGSDEPIPPPPTDEQKIAAIAAMFRPGEPAALTAALRAKVKTACTILEIWGKNTPTELFLLFGDDALNASTLERALAKALDDRQARIDAEKAQKASETPLEAPSSISQALKAQQEKVAKVESVLSGLDDVQRTKVEAGLERLGISSDAAAKELWLSFGPASLDAGTLVEALEKPPWETPDGGEA